LWRSDTELLREMIGFAAETADVVGLLDAAFSVSSQRSKSTAVRLRLRMAARRMPMPSRVVLRPPPLRNHERLKNR
jgi:hypothetical protein